MRVLNWNIQWGRGIDGCVDLARTAAVVPAPTFGGHDCNCLAEPACQDFFFVSASLAACVRNVKVDSATETSDHQPVVLEWDDDRCVW